MWGEVGCGCKTCLGFMRELRLFPKGNGNVTKTFEAGKEYYQICGFRKITLATGGRMMEAESPNRKLWQ